MLLVEVEVMESDANIQHLGISRTIQPC